MGFQSPQFDFIDQRFNHRRIKTLEVICSEDVQAVLDDPVTVTSATGDLADIINLQTGQLQPGVRVVVTDIDPGVAVAPNKVCNIFLVTWSIVDTTGAVLFAPEAPTLVSDAVKCPGAGLGPSQTVVQKHDIQVNFCLVPIDTDENGIYDTLFALIDIEYCLVVANEVILKIDAAQPFCP